MLTTLPGAQGIPPLVATLPIGLGAVLVVLALAVIGGLAWLIGTELRLREWKIRCPRDGQLVRVTVDRRRRVVCCTPPPSVRAVVCDQECLRLMA